MNLLDVVSNSFSTVKNFFSRLVTSEQFKRAKAVAKTVGDLLPYAIRAVDFVAKLTPNKTDDQIAAALKLLGVQVELDPNTPLSDVTKKGLLLAAAGAALRGNLEQAILNSAGAGLKLGDQVVKDKTSLPDNVIDTAVQTAYTFTKAAVGL